jgi:hypothetical protein
MVFMFEEQIARVHHYARVLEEQLRLARFFCDDAIAALASLEASGCRQLTFLELRAGQQLVLAGGDALALEKRSTSLIAEGHARGADALRAFRDSGFWIVLATELEDPETPDLGTYDHFNSEVADSLKDLPEEPLGAGAQGPATSDVGELFARFDWFGEAVPSQASLRWEMTIEEPHLLFSPSDYPDTWPDETGWIQLVLSEGMALENVDGVLYFVKADDSHSEVRSCVARIAMNRAAPTTLMVDEKTFRNGVRWLPAQL